MDSKFNLPTETIELPSRGLLYSEDSPLANGTLEMKYMTAKEEDILSNPNYIRQGTVIDKLLQSLIVSKIDYNELLVGDKNAIMLAARILAYGKDYQITYEGSTVDVDLTQFVNKDIDYSKFKERRNEFEFKLPNTDNVITFKLLTHRDEQTIEKEIAGRKKIDKNLSTNVSSRLKQMITSVNGLTERKDIHEFVDNYLLAKDARALREYYSSISPDVDLTISVINAEGVEEDVDMPIGVNFFWPDA